MQKKRDFLSEKRESGKTLKKREFTPESGSVDTYEIGKQLIFVSITSQESLPVRRNRLSFKHALSLRSATVCSTINCFRLFVRYLFQTISTLLTVSS